MKKGKKEGGGEGKIYEQFSKMKEYGDLNCSESTFLAE